MRQVLPKHVYNSYENSIDCDLVEAILRGDADKVREAIQLGANVNAAESRHEATTPLIWAARQGNPEIPGILIAAGAQLYHATLPSYLNPSETTEVTVKTAIGEALNLDNKPVAKAFLKLATHLEIHPIYSGFDETHKLKIEALRGEMAREVPGEEKGDNSSPKYPCANLLFYRLKHGCFLVAGVLMPAIGGVVFGSSAVGVLCATAAVAFSANCFGFEFNKNNPSFEDLNKGYQLLMSEGVKATIIKLCSSRSYEEFSYQPIGMLKQNPYWDKDHEIIR